VINQKYGAIIEAMYQGEKAIPVDTTIAFQDGTRQRIRTTLRVLSTTPQLQAAE
jgi:long-chain acyl-CoA synthetase